MKLKETLFVAAYAVPVRAIIFLQQSRYETPLR